jgi:glycosyltransferase involved in cell wall biosynthesis
MTACRVLYLDHAPFLGGAQVVLLNLIRSLPASQWAPMVATSANSPLVTALAGSGVFVQAVALERLNQSGPAMAARWLRAAVSVARLARQQRVDILHSNTVRAHLVGSLAACLARKPLVWTLHDNTLPRRAARAFAWAPARVIAVSSWIKQYFASAGLSPKTEVIPNGLEINTGVEMDRVAGGLRAELGVPPDAPFIVNVGRLVAGKAPHVFVEAARAVASVAPQAVFALVGAADTPEPGQPADGYASMVLAKAILDSGLGERLMLTGHRADAARFFSAADVVVYSSILPEGFPTVLLETMQAARPVVASAIGGALEIVQDGVTGRLVAPGDARAMAAGILECLQNPERARAWGRNGQSRLAQTFNLHGQVRQTEAVYRAVLASQRKAAECLA